MWAPLNLICEWEVFGITVIIIAPVAFTILVIVTFGVV